MIIISLFLSFGCSQKENNPAAPEEEKKIFSETSFTKSDIHGVWKSLEDNGIAYILYDSSSSYFSEKRDYGYNFRSELSSYSSLVGNQFMWGVGDGTYDTWWWMKINESKDTLTGSYDSLFAHEVHFIRSSLTNDLQNWLEYLTPTSVEDYSTFNKYVRALSYNEDCLYILSGNKDDIELTKYSNDGTKLANYSFPGIFAMEVVDSNLWLAGNFYVENRKVKDTTLVSKFYFHEYLAPEFPTEWVSSLVVTDSLVYVVTNWNGTLTFTINGTFIRKDGSYMGLGDLHYSDGRLWGVTGQTIFHEIDITNNKSIHSYLPLYNDYPHFNGITIRNGKLLCADFLEDNLRLFEFEIPK